MKEQLWKSHLETLSEWHLMAAVKDYEIMENPSREETMIFNEVVSEIGRRKIEEFKTKHI